MNAISDFNSKSCIIVCSVPLSNEEKTMLKNSRDFLIGVDYGYKQLLQLGIMPDLTVGDFDSAPRPEYEAEIISLPAEKDDTDAFYAAQLAVQRGFSNISICGAWGKRADHSLANLQLMLFLAENGIANKLHVAGGTISCLGAGEHKLKRKEGCCFSLLAAGGTAQGVCLEGAKYPLNNAELTPNYPLGISNEFEEDTVILKFKTGYIYAFVIEIN